VTRTRGSAFSLSLWRRGWRLVGVAVACLLAAWAVAAPPGPASHVLASLADVAPTVLRLLGVPVVKLRPDGRVLEEALS
jgi:arylsulfatase A-like enzyme